ncbi:hypothetical protein [Sphaerisporangium aureirubrum]|uniref:Serine/threonine protein kinase n=1 Tax=Sphaerisporangium aureirubrum TaxID=1544736 RepID=A0ABW1N8A4_9ACTN
MGGERSNEPARTGGDLLSDGWTPGQETAHALSDDASGLAGGDREDDHEPVESLEGFDYLYRSEGPEASGDHERTEGDEPEWDTDGGGDRGFLGSGWTGESDPEEQRGNKNKQLVLAMVAIVLLTVAGGWILSSSVGSSPVAECSASGDCASGGQQGAAVTGSPTAGPSLSDPATAGPEDTGAPPVETPGPTTSQVRATDQPTSRPTPTRTRGQSARPSPRASSRPQPSDPRIEDEPQRSPAPPPTSEAPRPAPSPTKTENGGVLDWLF